MKSIGHFNDKVKEQECVFYILRMFLLFVIMMHETFIILIETNVIFTVFRYGYFCISLKNQIICFLINLYV